MWILGALLACGTPSADAPSADAPSADAPSAEQPIPDPPSQETRSAPARPQPNAQAVRPSDPDDPLTPALQRIYDEATCLGAFSSVQVFRDAKGEVQRLYYSGTPAICSHPPSAYYDADGTFLESVPMKPLTDNNRAFFEALHDRHRHGLVSAERLTFAK